VKLEKRRGCHEPGNIAHPEISGHAGTVPGEDSSANTKSANSLTLTTCIGCKACEVACMEWNDLPFGETVFDNTYQTMPETRWNY